MVSGQYPHLSQLAAIPIQCWLVIKLSSNIIQSSLFHFFIITIFVLAIISFLPWFCPRRSYCISFPICLSFFPSTLIRIARCARYLKIHRTTEACDSKRKILKKWANLHLQRILGADLAWPKQHKWCLRLNCVQIRELLDAHVDLSTIYADTHIEIKALAHWHRKIDFRFSKNWRLRRLQILKFPNCQMCKILKISCRCLSWLFILPLKVTVSSKDAQGRLGFHVCTVETWKHAHSHRPYLQFCLQQRKVRLEKNTTNTRWVANYMAPRKTANGKL